ncbi:tetratricopeptide repeat-containing sensor histidine kinase [Sphingobacterium composti Ten et al. 2007 non Yoo et al. 2007]|uniref:tetratricopeptide repeat-containing sensor histidine kinase n=1 Tax=Sphingobacterium composti TaxID=363260 RepID=UPI0013585074|nr:tetratricopeptide repeat-containing sensor histidine kinase [Sphingobacterium composti Ten et al. 2007 non Yoo et al. 2007]
MKLLKTLLGTFFVFFVFVNFNFAHPISKELAQFNDSLNLLIDKEKDYKKLRIYITDLLNKNYLTNRAFVIEYIENHVLENPNYMRDTVFYANTINTYAICFLDSDLDKAIEFAKRGINYIGESNNPEILEKVALLSSNLANAYAALGHHNSRLKVYADIHPIILKTKNAQIIRHHNFKLGGVYYQFNELDKALSHLRKGIFVEEDFNWHPNFAGMGETLIASVYFKKNEIDSVKKYIYIADRIKRSELPVAYKSRINSLIGLTAASEGDFTEAFKRIEESYKIALVGKDTSELMFSEYIKGRAFAYKNDYSSAIKIYNDVLDRYVHPDLDHYKNYILMSLIAAYKATNQQLKAYETYDRLLRFFDHQKLSNQQLYAVELSYNMKFNEKLAEIDRLKVSNEKAEITKQRNQVFIGGLCMLLLFVLVVLFLILKAQKRNKILAKQELDLLEVKLEEEKNNRVIDEMTLLKQVEDRERNRIATDLHDSIGGLLSSIKIALFSYQESAKLNANETQHTNRILDYIDDTKQELNRIVYNLTPLIVEKFGLLEAIKQYTKKIQTDQLNINLQLISIPTNIIMEDEITLYRIIQEVLHNIVKHAIAKNILLQIQTDYTSGMVIISIEDDGQGMNVHEAMTKGGLGMKSMYSRVQNLKGSITIESNKDVGTTVYINCFPKSIKENVLIS